MDSETYKQRFPYIQAEIKLRLKQRYKEAVQTWILDECKALRLSPEQTAMIVKVWKGAE